MNSVRISQPSYKKLLFAALVTLFALFVGSGNTLYSANNQLPWVKVDDFENLSGDIDGDNGWSTVGAVSVISDPADSENKVLNISGENNQAYKTLPSSILNNSTGTIFFRMRRNSNADVFGGLSDESAPSAFSDFEAQFGAQSAHQGDFTARSGDSFLQSSGGFENNTWYCVWLVANNDFNKYSAYVEGGQYAEITKISGGSSSNFNFRNGGTNNLKTFFARSGQDAGAFYFDDIYLDPGQIHLDKPSGDCPSSNDPEPSEGWQSVENFFGLNNGPINNRNGWSASSDTVVITTDPDNSSDKVLSISGSNRRVYKTLPEPITNAETGTLFFRMRRSGNIDAFGGLSDVSAPSDFSDFETQFGGQSANPGDFRIRDGGSFVGNSDSFHNNAWYCIWLVTNNLNNNYTAHVSGGQYNSVTKISAGGSSTFNFRNGGSNPLQTFFARNGVDNGTIYIDDIYIDAEQSNLSKPDGNCPASDDPEPTEGWETIDNFSGLANGPINNKNGWEADSGVIVTADPDNNSNKILSITGNNQSAFNTLPASIGFEQQGTLFFRMQRNGNADTFAGASASNTPTDFDDFELQVGAQTANVGDFAVRDGLEQFRYTAGFENNQWYCVWIYTSSDSEFGPYYTVRAEGGQLTQPTRIGDDTHVYRNEEYRTLQTFFARSGQDSGSMFFDDIYFSFGENDTSKPDGDCPASDDPEPAEGWESVDNFDGLNNGSINNQNGWDADNGVVVTTDPDNSGNKVLSISGSNTDVSKAFPSNIGIDSSGTIFFRMRRSGNADVFAGASGDNAPSAFDDFEIQFGSQATNIGDFTGREGGAYNHSSGGFENNQWYCVWMFARNHSNTPYNPSYDITIEGGHYDEPTEFFDGHFNFRNGQNIPLQSFFARSGQSGGTLFVDDVYINAGQFDSSKPDGDCPTSDGPPPEPPEPNRDWLPVDDFNNLSIGPVNNKNGWGADNKVLVTTDPDNSNDKVLSISGSNQRASITLPEPFSYTEYGTVFFRMRRVGNADVFAGVSDDRTPANFSDFGAQVGAQSAYPGTIRFNNQNEYVGSDPFLADTWYCVWLSVYNYENISSVSILGGQFNEETFLQPLPMPRNGSPSLRTFFIRSGVDTGELLIDDIHLKTAHWTSEQPHPEKKCPTTTEPEPTEGWQSVDSFNGLNNGPINGQNGWKSNNSIVVTADPDNSNDKVLGVMGKDKSAYKALPESIINSETGTLFFRMRRSGNVDAFGGLSDVATPMNFSDFETQVGTQSGAASDFRIRDGEDFKSVANEFQAEVWYCVWLVTDNMNNGYTVSVSGGQYNGRTQLSAENQSSFGFRNGGTNSLTTFFTRSGLDNGTLYIDDVYVDAGNLNFAQPGGNCPYMEVNGWQKVDNFNNLSNGNIDSRNGWKASNGVSVTTDPDNSNDKVLHISDSNSFAHKAFPELVSNSSKGSLFFRLRRTGDVDAFGGASDVTNPTEFDDYEVQFGAQSIHPNEFRIRDGGNFITPPASFAENEWHCVWLHFDNSTNLFNTYVQGGDSYEQNWIHQNAQFRNGGDNILRTFLARNGVDSGSLYIDDIFIDAGQYNFTQPDGYCHGPNDPEPPAGWQEVDNFTELALGKIDGQGSWSASSDVEVVIDPSDTNNKVIQIEGKDQSVSKAFPETISNNATGTLFFRMRKVGEPDMFGGISDQSNPSQFNDFELQIGSQTIAPGEFKIRSGENYVDVQNSYRDDTWFCVWLVADNMSDNYNIFVLGGEEHYEPRILASNGYTSFDFRNGGNSALNTFFAKSRLRGDRLYFDDIYIDPNQKNLTRPNGECDRDGYNGPPYFWSVVDDLSGATNGPLDNRNGWVATNGAVVTDAPDEPGNKVISVSGDEVEAYLPLGPLVYSEDTGVFFRMRRSGAVNGFAGATDVNSPSEWSDYELQFGAQSNTPSDFKVRNQDEFLTVENQFKEDTWYCVWLLAPSNSKEYQILIYGGQFGSDLNDNETRLYAEGQNLFGIRNGGVNQLDRFFIRTGSGQSGTLYIDDIYSNYEDWSDDAEGEDFAEGIYTKAKRICPRDNANDNNSRPVASVDSANVLQNRAVNIDVLGNDEDPDGDYLYLTTDLVSEPNHGRAYGQGTLVYYEPDTDFVGIDSFIYEVCDTGTPNLCSQATVTVNVIANEEDCYPLNLVHTGSGQAPYAQFSSSPGCPTGYYAAGDNIDVYASPSYLWKTQSWDGTLNDNLSWNVNTIHMPASAHTATANYVAVNSENNAPTANPDSYEVVKNSSSNEFDVLANDSTYPDEGEVMSISGVGETNQGGQVSQYGNSVRYTPPANFTGEDRFSYTLSDGNGGFDTTEVIVTVIGDLPEVRYIDVVISLYRTANPADRQKYETIMDHFADAIYEMSNGAHKVRTITIYQNSEAHNWADVHWNESEWPRAHLSGVQSEYRNIWMGDIFAFPSPYDALSDSHLKGTGYTLAHEYGHYYYGVLDEYAAITGDEAVPNSVMNSQWLAAQWGNNNLNYLNFSIPKNNIINGRLRKTNQNRFYAASGWETLVRLPSFDPFYATQSPPRPYYPELSLTAPVGNNDSPLDIDANRGIEEARGALNIVWQEPTAGAPAFGNLFNSSISSASGETVNYPNPVVLTAKIEKDDLITGAGVTASVTTPNGSFASLTLTDDGIAPDQIAGDGYYNGYMPYSMDGYYSISITFDNDADNAIYTTLSGTPTPPIENGDKYIPRTDPVGEAFNSTATAVVRIDGFTTDDHSASTANATNITIDNQPTEGQIDSAGDVDMFQVTAAETGEFAIRITSLAAGMQANIKVLAADGQTILSNDQFSQGDADYYFKLLNASAGDRFYVEISHTDPTASAGTYKVSAGAPHPSEITVIDEPRLIYLPLIQNK